MRDFGNQERLLMSSERQSLWSIVSQFSNEEGLRISPYYCRLDPQKAKADNVNLETLGSLNLKLI